MEVADGVEVMKMEEDEPELKLSVLGRLRLCGLATLTLALSLPPPPISSQLSGEERKAESAAVVPLLPPLPLLPSVPLAGEDLCPVGSSSPRELPELSVEAALLELELVAFDSSSDSSDSTVLREFLYRRSLFLGCCSLPLICCSPGAPPRDVLGSAAASSLDSGLPPPPVPSSGPMMTELSWLIMMMVVILALLSFPFAAAAFSVLLMRLLCNPLISLIGR